MNTLLKMFKTPLGLRWIELINKSEPMHRVKPQAASPPPKRCRVLNFYHTPSHGIKTVILLRVSLTQIKSFVPSSPTYQNLLWPQSHNAALFRHHPRPPSPRALHMRRLRIRESYSRKVLFWYTSIRLHLLFRSCVYGSQANKQDEYAIWTKHRVYLCR